jgi:hypothetical protein
MADLEGWKCMKCGKTVKKPGDTHECSNSRLIDGLCAKPLAGRWRYSEGFLFCGSIRVCGISLDTNPSQEFTDEIGSWMAGKLGT